MYKLRSLGKFVLFLLVFAMLVTASGLAAPLHKEAHALSEYYFHYYSNIPGASSQNDYFYTANPVRIIANIYDYPGYRFVGWNTRPDGTGTWRQPDTNYYFSPSVRVSNVRLYAQWRKIVYAQYSSNGGGTTGVVSDSTGYISGETVVLQPNTYTRENYTFSGWNTKADGSGTPLNAGASYVVTDEDAANGLTFYAQWDGDAVSIPKTGDTSAAAFFMTAALLGCAALFAILVFQKKKSRGG